MPKLPHRPFFRDAIAKGADLEDEVKQRVAVLEANARRSAADLVRLAADAAGKQLASLRETAQEALDARAQTLVDQLMARRHRGAAGGPWGGL